MQRQSATEQLRFQGLGKRSVTASFDGGTITSDAGALLLRAVEAARGIIGKFATCFIDHRDQRYVEHSVWSMIAQRVYGLCLGYEDVVDHDRLREDPLIATLCEQPDVEGSGRRRDRDRGKPLAGKSTLNRLETAVPALSSRYKKIGWDEAAIARSFVDVFLSSYQSEPQQIVLDLDATDDPLHGHQEGRFFHGYYDCYCYLPLYIFCEDHLLCAKLREADGGESRGAQQELERIVAQIRERWPQVQILIRGDSGFSADQLMSWCERNDVEYVLGIAQNKRLLRRLQRDLDIAGRQYGRTGEPVRRFKDFTYRTLKSWSRRRRVIGKAEFLAKGANPRFVVTSLSKKTIDAQQLYEQTYCARGEMENRIKEQQLYLFADRTSSHTMHANQLRLWLSSIAYLLMSELRRRALHDTELASAQCDTIRLKLLKTGAQVHLSVRRISLRLASSYPYQQVFRQAYANLSRAGPNLA